MKFYLLAIFVLAFAISANVVSDEAFKNEVSENVEILPDAAGLVANDELVENDVPDKKFTVSDVFQAIRNFIKNLMGSKDEENQTVEQNEIIEESTEEIVEDVIEDVAEESVEEPVEEIVEEPIEETVEESVEETIEETIEEPLEEAIEEAVEESVEEAVEKTDEEIVEVATEEVLEETVDQIIEEDIEENVEDKVEAAEENVIEIIEGSTEQNATVTFSDIVEDIVEETFEEVVEEPEEDVEEIEVESNKDETIDESIETDGSEEQIEDEPEISFESKNECRDNSDTEGLPLPCESLIVLCNLKDSRITKTCKKTCGLCGDNKTESEEEKAEQDEILEKEIQEETVVDCLTLPEDHTNCDVWLAVDNACEVDGIKNFCARSCNKC